MRPTGMEKAWSVRTNSSSEPAAMTVTGPTRCEVQQTERGREIEVIPLRFSREGTGLVLVGVG